MKVIMATNRIESLDPALLRPGRLEVRLHVRRPDAAGRRAVARIHTRAMAAKRLKMHPVFAKAMA